jgi:hypothetical protein
MFKIANMRSMKERPMERYITNDNEAIALGEALVLTSGALTKCAADATPEFIAMEATADEAIISVVRVTEDMVFETTFAADASAEEEGEKVTIHTDGLQVTATNTNGVFTITKKLGDGTSGTKVLGMFRR